MKVIYNGRIITLNEDLPFLDNGAIAIENGKIVEIGSSFEMLSKYKDAELIDARQGLIIPGFINTHMHLYSTFARGFGFDGASPSNFKEILEQIWWRMDKLLDAEDEALIFPHGGGGVVPGIGHHLGDTDAPGLVT